MKKTLLTILATACLAVATAHADWIYLVPDDTVYGFRDCAGVPHVFETEQARYDQRTRIYQVLIRGPWLTVGEYVYQLTDY
jgi:hypothetical protein